MKYKKGDRVKVKTDLKPGAYDAVMFVEEMNCLKGKVVTISEVVERGGRYRYRVKELIKYSHYLWSSEMFENKAGGSKMKNPTHIIIYEKRNKDPVDYGYGVDDTRIKVEDLVDDSDVDNDSIKVFEIKKEVKVSLVKVKITF